MRVRESGRVDLNEIRRFPSPLRVIPVYRDLSFGCTDSSALSSACGSTKSLVS